MSLLSITTTKTRFSSTSYRGKSLLLTTAILLFLATTSLAQNAGDYRTRDNADWSSTTLWQRFNGTSWVNVTTSPTSADGVITIIGGHTVTLDQSVTVDQLVISINGKLNFKKNASPVIILTITDGSGIDLINNGTLTLSDDTNSDAVLILNGQMDNNNTVTVETDSQFNVFGTLTNNKDIDLQGFSNSTGSWFGRLNIYAGATLKCSPTSLVKSSTTVGGNFVLSSGATIEIGSPAGISTLGTNSGNIQSTHIRAFSPEADYIYNGTAPQQTGNALKQANGLILSNTAAPVTFTRRVSANYIVINTNNKANLKNDSVHTAGTLLLDISHSNDTWGGTGSSGISPATHHVEPTYFTATTGYIQLTNTAATVTYAALPGQNTWTFNPCFPENLAVTVEAWGGGGNGGRCIDTNAPIGTANGGAGGGGGGGAYSKSLVNILPTETYTVSVGRGGVNGSPGEDSWFKLSTASIETVKAKGGSSVGNNSLAKDTTEGAIGGLATDGIGDVKYSGGNGANGTYDATPDKTKNYGGGGGSSSGKNANGNNATNTATPTDSWMGATAPESGGNGGDGKLGNTGSGKPGDTPGGGGGGAYKREWLTNRTLVVEGGAGGNGLIRLTYKPIFPTITFYKPFPICKDKLTADLPYVATGGCPDKYKIVYDAAAKAIGFQDIPYSALPASTIPLAVPAGAPIGTYNGYLTVLNSGTKYASRNYPFTVIIGGNVWTGAVSTDWYTLANWSCEIPKATSDITIPAYAPNKPIIPLKPASATETARCRNIIIDSGASVTVDSLGVFTVFGKMTNNNGENGMIVKAGKTTANGSLLFKDPSQNNNIPATVEMFTKGHRGSLWKVTTPDGKKTYEGYYRWQYFGIPIKTVTANPTFYGSYLREYKEDLNMNDYYLKWKDVTNWDILQPFKGYEITQTIDPGQYKLITFRGSLITEDKTLTLSKTVLPSSLNYSSGNHVFGNSYTAAIDITKIVFSTDVQKVVYIYSTGSLKNWQDALTPPESLSTAGGYISVPQNLAESSLLPREITSMQGFALTTLSDGATVYIPYNATTSSVKDNTYAQRVKSKYQQSNKANVEGDEDESSKFSCLIIDILSEGGNDRTWLFSQPGTTHGYDDGWDGEKVSFGGVSIYSDEGSEMFQVSTVDNVNGTYLAFRGTENVTDYTIRIKNFHLLDKYDYVKLVDLATNQEIPLVNENTSYNFTANNTILPEKRFLISTQRTATSVDNTKASQNINIFASSQTIHRLNGISENGNIEISDLKGSIVLKDMVSANSRKSINTHLSEGIYLVKVKTNSTVKTEKVVIKK